MSLTFLGKKSRMIIFKTFLLEATHDFSCLITVNDSEARETIYLAVFVFHLQVTIKKNKEILGGTNDWSHTTDRQEGAQNTNTAGYLQTHGTLNSAAFLKCELRA